MMRWLYPQRGTWKLSNKSIDGCVALTLFIDSMKKLMRKTDFIIPHLAVCYAFFYTDKTTLSYTAIFSMRKDLILHGTQ